MPDDLSMRYSKWMSSGRQIVIGGRVLFVQYAAFLYLDGIVLIENNIDNIVKTNIVLSVHLLILFAFVLSLYALY